MLPFMRGPHTTLLFPGILAPGSALNHCHYVHFWVNYLPRLRVSRKYRLYMKLTERQENMVGIFLRESGHTIQELSPSAKAQTLRMIRRRLRHELLQLGDVTVQDGELGELLGRLRVSPKGWMPPGDRVESMTVSPQQVRRARSNRPIRTERERSRRQMRVTAPDEPLPTSPDRRCLGVCLALSERHPYGVSTIRRAFLIGGLLTGPLALVVYLTLYFERYAPAAGDPERNIDRRRLASSVAGTSFVLAAMFAAAWVLFQAPPILFEKLSGTPIRLGAWGRFENYNALLLFVAFLALSPAAVLRGLPIHEKSREAVANGLLAGFVCYGAILCYGIALCLTGVLIAATEFLAG